MLPIIQRKKMTPEEFAVMKRSRMFVTQNRYQILREDSEYLHKIAEEAFDEFYGNPYDDSLRRKARDRIEIVNITEKIIGEKCQ